MMLLPARRITRTTRSLIAAAFLASVSFLAPAKPALMAASTPTPASNSRNWAGFAITGSPPRRISAHWTVPATTGRGSVAVWIGLGGDPQHRLLQTGTLARQTRKGVSTMLWIEGLPAPMVPIATGLRPGTPVSVTIQRVRGTLTLAAGAFFWSRTLAYPLDPHSAEWIVEDPMMESLRPHFAKFGRFTPVAITHSTAVINNQIVTPSSGIAIPMATHRRAWALPSLAATGFAVTRTIPGAAKA